MFEKFTEKATKVIMLAREESRRMGHNFTGTEQILLGLLGESTGVAAKVLKSMGVNLEDARIEVEKIIGRGSGFVSPEIPFTPRLKRVLELATVEARQLGHNYIGTEHLLLGLIREGEGVAVRVLEIAGVDLAKMRGLTLKALQNGISNAPATDINQSTSVEQEPIQLPFQPIDFVCGAVIARLAASLSNWVEARGLGQVVVGAGFWLPGGKILAPAVAFVSDQHLKRIPRLYSEVLPVLVIECKSAVEPGTYVQGKIQAFIDAGTASAILIDPDAGTGTIYRFGEPDLVIEGEGILELPELLPGWQMTIPLF